MPKWKGGPDVVLIIPAISYNLTLAVSVLVRIFLCLDARVLLFCHVLLIGLIRKREGQLGLGNSVTKDDISNSIAKLLSGKKRNQNGRNSIPPVCQNLTRYNGNLVCIFKVSIRVALVLVPYF